jgi:very-short-patch-repair endonuclease
MNAHAKCEKEQKKIHFRQQVPIGPYFADFYCKYLSLDVEIDGGYHDHTKAYDLTRDLYMARRWIIVMRFKNDEVLTDIQTVISKIFDKNIRRELWDKLEWNCVGKRIQNIDCELWEMDFDEFQTLLR